MADLVARWSAPPPERSPTSRKKILLGCGGLLAGLAVVFTALVLALSSLLRQGNAVVEASGGRITSFQAFSNGPVTTVTFVAARRIDEAQGPSLACDVVRPVLAGTGWASARWTIVNRAGDVIASDQTPCP